MHIAKTFMYVNSQTLILLDVKYKQRNNTNFYMANRIARNDKKTRNIVLLTCLVTSFAYFFDVYN